MKTIRGLPGITGLEYVPGLNSTLGKAVGVVDVDKDEVIKVLRFNSETGTPGYDSAAKRIYVTLRSTNVVTEMDESTTMP